MEAPPREGAVAILAADIEGYSRLMHEDEERTLATLTAHRRIIDDLIVAGRGEISGTAGDSGLRRIRERGRRASLRRRHPAGAHESQPGAPTRGHDDAAHRHQRRRRDGEGRQHLR